MHKVNLVFLHFFGRVESREHPRDLGPSNPFSAINGTDYNLGRVLLSSARRAGYDAQDTAGPKI